MRFGEGNYSLTGLLWSHSIQTICLHTYSLVKPILWVGFFMGRIEDLGGLWRIIISSIEIEGWILKNLTRQGCCVEWGRYFVFSLFGMFQFYSVET